MAESQLYLDILGTSGLRRTGGYAPGDRSAVPEGYQRPGVYRIRCTNGKVYIGQAQNVHARLRSHCGALRRGKHGNEHLQRAWNKYGEDAFVFEPILFLPIERLDVTEQALLNSTPRERKFNIALDAAAPTRGLIRPHTEETKAKIGAANKIAHARAETKAKMSALGKARQLSSEQRARLASGLSRGSKRTQEWKDAMSARLLGKKQTPEHLAKRIASLKEGNKKRREHRG